MGSLFPSCIISFTFFAIFTGRPVTPIASIYTIFPIQAVTPIYAITSIYAVLAVYAITPVAGYVARGVLNTKEWLINL